MAGTGAYQRRKTSKRYRAFQRAEGAADMERAQDAEAGTSAAPRREQAPVPWWMKMRLHMVRGSLFAPGSSSSASDGSGGGRGGLGSAECPVALDARVWSRMPDDILWRVLRLLPPGKQVQLQLVSRKWRQVLTSADFHAACAADEELAIERQQQHPRVVACATHPDARDITSDTSTSTSNMSRPEDVVEIDLSFLPRKWFRRTHACYAAVLASGPSTTRFYSPYFVHAAGDGLVCIAVTDVATDIMARNVNAAVPQLCVLNPLTRTYRTLPALPLVLANGKPWQITAAAVTTLTFVMHHSNSEYYIDWAVGTCALEGGGGAAWAVTHGRVRIPAAPAPVPPGSRCCSTAALCGGQVLWCLDGQLRVLDVAAAAAAGDSEAATGPGDAALAAPSVETLGLDAAAAAACCYRTSEMWLLAHRGTLFLLAHLLDPRADMRPHTQVACGLWRLAMARADRPMEWHPVTRLDVAEVERLAGLGPASERRVTLVWFVWAVRELLCVNLDVCPGKIPALAHRCVLGFNLDAGQWELVDELLCQRRIAPHLELRPHFFLS